MAIRMFDVSQEQQEKGLDGQVAKEDTVQGDGPPETRSRTVASRPENSPRYGVKFEDGKPVPKEKHVPPGPDAPPPTTEAEEARLAVEQLAAEEEEMETTNHGLRYAMRPVKDWVLGKIEFPDEIIEEINGHIDNVIIPANNSYAEGLVGQLKQAEESAQLDFPLDDEIGAQLKTVFDQIGSTYLKNGYDRDARAECYQCWSNHAYAGDYNPLHDHGVQTPAGLSGFLWLKVPSCIEELPDVNPKINDAGGGVDGFTHLVWGTNSRRDMLQLKPQTEDYVKPVVGTMLVFPQWLKHQVMPFFGVGERRSMAMNWNVHDSEQEMRKYMSDREWAQLQANKEKLTD